MQENFRNNKPRKTWTLIVIAAALFLAFAWGLSYFSGSWKIQGSTTGTIEIVKVEPDRYQSDTMTVSVRLDNGQIVRAPIEPILVPVKNDKVKLVFLKNTRTGRLKYKVVEKIQD